MCLSFNVSCMPPVLYFQLLQLLLCFQRHVTCASHFIRLRSVVLERHNASVPFNSKSTRSLLQLIFSCLPNDVVNLWSVCTWKTDVLCCGIKVLQKYCALSSYCLNNLLVLPFAYFYC